MSECFRYDVYKFDYFYVVKEFGWGFNLLGLIILSFRNIGLCRIFGIFVLLDNNEIICVILGWEEVFFCE